jgi:hypothetical protein
MRIASRLERGPQSGLQEKSWKARTSDVGLRTSEIRIYSLLKNSVQAPQGLKASQKNRLYRSAESATLPKSEFFSTLFR